MAKHEPRYPGFSRRSTTIFSVASVSAGESSGSTSIHVTVNAPGIVSRPVSTRIPVPEAEERLDVGRRDVYLQAQLAEHRPGVEVADHLADAVGVGVVGEEVGTGKVDGGTRRRAHRRGTGVRAQHAPLRGRRGVARGRDGFDVEVEVGKPGREPLDVGGERVAADRAAGGGVLVGAVIGERGHDGFAIVSVPGVEVAVECVGDGHQRPLR